MDFHPVYDENGRIERWESTHLADGYQIVIRRCADDSGYIAKIVDLFTGITLHQLFGSTAMILHNTAVDRMNKTKVYDTLAFA